MAKPYSRDLRDGLVQATLAGRSRHEAARTFDVSPSYVIKLLQRFEPTGDCRPRKFGGHKFFRPFAEFVQGDLPDKMHAALIERALGERIIGVIARDSTEIEAREKTVEKNQNDKNDPSPPSPTSTPPAVGA